ncbi:glycosyltransferase family 4 protein [Bacillus infantis]|uniref:glycosyltransferase family 4 protein n=1 Tax=Bacillus infantis TaxID=324767 RepID=UPI00209E5630|nr:glycosyltransferase family 1 protein [Bacillus infantis]MCP1161179.1 glycosyltransferase family 1 protein [Bacillus infantis]
MRVKVAIFSDTFYPQINGVANTLKRLTDHLEKRDIEYMLFIPGPAEGMSYPNAAEFLSIPFFFYPECRTAVANPRKITERLQKFSPDIVHIATPLTMGLYGIHAAKKLGIPITGSYHTHFDQYLKLYKCQWLSPLFWKYMKWFHRSFQRIFVPSKDTKTILEAQGLQSVSLWTRGVDSRLFHPDRDKEAVRKEFGIREPHILLYAGRLAPEKDLGTLLKTMGSLPEEIRERVHWLIVGDGPEFQPFAKESAGRGNVTMTGYVTGEELAGLYAAADLLVFPSPTETFGNVVLEALSSGTPAIVADKGGPAEIISEGRTGRICPAGSSGEFASAIQELLGDPVKLASMSREARSYAERQSWDKIMDQLLAEYKEIAFEGEYRFRNLG